MKCDAASFNSSLNMASQKARMAGTRGQQAREWEFWKESKYICTHAGTSSMRRRCNVKDMTGRLFSVMEKRLEH
jgi:hypothetical protein